MVRLPNSPVAQSLRTEGGQHRQAARVRSALGSPPAISPTATARGLATATSAHPPTFEDPRSSFNNPTWGDPTYRLIPRDLPQDRVAAAHLHINTRDVYEDIDVALPLRTFEQ
ncbi:MAG: hypothetical protein HOH95_11185, partial [Dehalococcoidia bacterium]|nr:hypothetical protein [Dehalococcoidia bacterium]